MKVQKYVFENGARLHYKRVKINNASKILVGIDTGAMFDEDKPGIAHFFEHMLFKGTEKRNVQQIKEEIRTVVPGLNARTSYKYVLMDFYQSNKMLNEACELVSDLLFNSTFPQEEIDKEFKVIEQEWAMSQDNHRLVANIISLQTAWSYPYFIDPLGDMSKLKKLKTEDFVAYRDKFLVPKNFVIYATGPMTFYKFKKSINRYFISKLNNSKVNYEKKELIFNGKSKVIIENKETKKCVFTISKPILQPRTIKDACVSSYVMQIFNGMGGRIWNKLREDEALVYSASCVRLQDKNDGFFSLYANITKQNIKRCVDVYAEIVRDLIINGVSQKEIDDIKCREKLSEDREITLHSAIANNLLFYYTEYGRYIAKKDWDKVRKDIGKKEVNSMIKKIFDTDIVWSVMVGNATAEDLYDIKELKKKFDFRKLIKKMRDKDCVTDG